jgi:hypothetical protein
VTVQAPLCPESLRSTHIPQRAELAGRSFASSWFPALLLASAWWPAASPGFSTN